VVGGWMWTDGCPKESTESLLLPWCKGAVGNGGIADGQSLRVG
jgi:hypothetical protein